MAWPALESWTKRARDFTVRPGTGGGQIQAAGGNAQGIATGRIGAAIHSRSDGFVRLQACRAYQSPAIGKVFAATKAFNAEDEERTQCRFLSGAWITLRLSTYPEISISRAHPKCGRPSCTRCATIAGLVWS